MRTSPTLILISNRSKLITKHIEIPTNVKILHKDFALTEFTGQEHVADGGSWGAINTVDASIKYVRGKLNSETVDTLIHEVLHGIARMMYMEFSSKEQEEDIVTQFATGLTTVFKDNPEVLAAIQKLLK